MSAVPGVFFGISDAVIGLVTYILGGFCFSFFLSEHALSSPLVFIEISRWVKFLVKKGDTDFNKYRWAAAVAVAVMCVESRGEGGMAAGLGEFCFRSGALW